MEQTMFKLSEEVKVGFIAKMADFVSKVKAASDDDAGTFDVIVSTNNKDRQGDIVDQNGWDLSFFKMNPVVLWAHDYTALPVAVCTNIQVEGNQLHAKGKFATAEMNPFAQQVRKMYDAKMLSATSVGFIPKEFDMEADNTISKAELLEFSFVPVPANPYALSLSQAKELGLDVLGLRQKGVTFKKDEVKVEKKAEKSNQLGDACSLSDGTPGVLATDPKNPDGPLVCVPDDTDSMKGKKAKVPVSAAVTALKEKVALENQRHSKSIQEAHELHYKNVKDAIDECMKDVADGDDSGDTAAAKALFEKEVKAIMFKAHKDTIKTAMDHMKTATAALEGVYASLDGNDDEGEKSKNGSKSLEGKRDEEITNFLEMRDLLKSVDNAVGTTLEAFNKRQKAKATSSK